jgi:NDP-sugar pyrophosphorylase family protein
MKAMVLAAGLGTRLRPLTNDRPKALVEVCGRTLLEITLARLQEFGVRQVIINVHHHADMVVDYLKAHDNFGMYIEVSREQELLDTGGGLKKARRFLEYSGGHGKKTAPFIVHNVDVVSTIDIARMAQSHDHTQSLATLAVQNRESSRRLLFDENSALCGRRKTGAADEVVRPAKQVHAWAFSGIHVISPRIFQLMNEEGAFSIIDCYLRLAAQGEAIMSFRADEYNWRDLGRPENIAQAEEEWKARDFAATSKLRP